MDIDECLSDSPCGFGRCDNLPGSFNCICKDPDDGFNSGYTTDSDGSCTIDVNECASDNPPCQNGATCTNKEGNDGKYLCECMEGWEGMDCDVDIDECARGTDDCSSLDDSEKRECKNIEGELYESSRCGAYCMCYVVSHF